jgi:hypothetical protein
MAGYMTKMAGYNYEGELVNGAASAVKNGVVMLLGTSTNNGKLVFPGSADTTSKFQCKEVTTIYDGLEGGVAKAAYRFIVDKLNANYYFVEQNFEPDETAAYDMTTMTTAVGAKLRAHPLQVGDEFVTTCVTGTINAGSQYGVKTDGTIG